MKEDLPLWISILFAGTVVGAIAWFKASTTSRKFLFIAVTWALLQSVLAIKGVFLDTFSLPPRIMALGVAPPLLLIILLFNTTKGKAFIDALHLKTLTWFHSIRIAVEIVLVLLFHQGLISVYMTFEGANFDILSGITAPAIAYFAFRNAEPNRNLLLAWNIFCLLLLLIIIFISALAVPSPFQKISPDQPNIAILYFPFNLLPSVVVPLVFFAHLVAIRRLTQNQKRGPLS